MLFSKEMETEKMRNSLETVNNMQKPNYMLMSIQRILLLIAIAFCVVVVVYFTPMPGWLFIIYCNTSRMKSKYSEVDIIISSILYRPYI